MFTDQIRTYGRLIKFSHTIFALPFALAAVLLAHRERPVSLWAFFWIVAAMVGARSAAMGFNRAADVRYDRVNPRTAARPSVTGEIGERSIIGFVALSSALFILSAAMLGKLCLLLSIPVLGILFAYSYTKRFTAYSHLFLGLAIGLAPTGAWIAATGSLDPRALLLTVALMTYIAGFDILYACQDVDFDRSEGLYSMPSRWGVEKSLQVSCILHGITFFTLAALRPAFHLDVAFVGALLAIGALLVAEHWLVRPNHMENINLAFFHVNSVISVLIFVGVLIA
mgnify:CR=1 FL=1